MKQYKVTVNGNVYDVTIEETACGPVASAAPVAAAAPAPGPVRSATPAAPAAPASPATETVVTSPLPGVIIGISVNVGDAVAAGQTVATLEAMKMENAIEAECAGTIRAIHVQKGDSVLEGAKLITIA